jgi:hypothetical protein
MSPGLRHLTFSKSTGTVEEIDVGRENKSIIER